MYKNWMALSESWFQEEIKETHFKMHNAQRTTYECSQYDENSDGMKMWHSMAHFLTVTFVYTYKCGSNR